jgi:hypothetical protein
MQSLQDQFIEFTQRGQESALKATRTWIDNLAEYAASAARAQPSLGIALDNAFGIALDNAFDYAEQVLRAQSALAATLLGTANEAVQAAQRAGEKAAAASRKAADDANKAATAAANHASK